MVAGLKLRAYHSGFPFVGKTMRIMMKTVVPVLAVVAGAGILIQSVMAADESTNAKAAVVSASDYPSPPEPNYGPEQGSIHFVDTDSGETIGGVLTMGPAIDEDGVRVDDAATGITIYMVHWGLEVGEPGVSDDPGAGDLGGNCKGFRDTGHVVKRSAEEAGNIMTWEIPQGTVVPDDAVYFVGHTVYGRIHNLSKCTQTPIHNIVEDQAITRITGIFYE